MFQGKIVSRLEKLIMKLMLEILLVYIYMDNDVMI